MPHATPSPAPGSRDTSSQSSESRSIDRSDLFTDHDESLDTLARLAATALDVDEVVCSIVGRRAIVHVGRHPVGSAPRREERRPASSLHAFLDRCLAEANVEHVDPAGEHWRTGAAIRSASGEPFGVLWCTSDRRRAGTAGFADALSDFALVAGKLADLDARRRQELLSAMLPRHTVVSLIKEAWQVATRDGVPLSLLLVGLDRFDRYEEHFGAVAATACVAEVADALWAAVHVPGALVARWSRSEFAIVLPGVARGRADGIGDAVVASVRALDLPFPDAESGAISASVGVCTADAEESVVAPALLIGAAEQALYRAASQGGDQRARTATASVLS